MIPTLLDVSAESWKTFIDNLFLRALLLTVLGQDYAYQI